MVALAVICTLILGMTTYVAGYTMGRNLSARQYEVLLEQNAHYISELELIIEKRIHD